MTACSSPCIAHCLAAAKTVGGGAAGGADPALVRALRKKVADQAEQIDVLVAEVAENREPSRAAEERAASLEAIVGGRKKEQKRA